MKKMFKNRRGGLSRILVGIFILIISLNLVSTYRYVGANTQNLLINQNKKILTVDRSIN